MTPTSNPQPPLVISEEAKTLCRQLGLDWIWTCHGETIQLAINQATEKLTKENEELRTEIALLVPLKHHYQVEIQTLTTRIKELEAKVERCNERETKLRKALIMFTRVERSFGHSGQHKPEECADCSRMISADEALSHGYIK